MRTYFIGFIKDGNRVIVQAKENKDLLDCELWEYWGERYTTKKYLRERREDILAKINEIYKTNFTRITID